MQINLLGREWPCHAIGGRPLAEASRKLYLQDTHRARDPAQTLAIICDHLPAMGITRIADLTGLDRIGLPTVMVTRPNSRSVAVSLGKGLSVEAARASGVMEAVETWHAERIELPLRLASYHELRGTTSVAEVARLPRVTGGEFNPDSPILWVEGRDLIGGGTCWVPFEIVDTDYTGPPRAGQGAFPRTTNGLASGNDLAEATCHALCEVIERDATTLWHHRPPGDRIDPESVEDARCRTALDRLRAAGIDAAIWDTTSDTGVPCFRCMICEAGDTPGHIGIGDGCHPDRAIALLRAVTEAAQTRLTYISGARDDLSPDEFTSGALAEKWGYVRGLLNSTQARVRFPNIPTQVNETFQDDLDWLCARLAAIGITQAVAVDLSRQGLGVSVVRAVIPGLEAPHDDPDFIAGPRALRAGEGA